MPSTLRSRLPVTICLFYSYIILQFRKNYGTSIFMWLCWVSIEHPKQLHIILCECCKIGSHSNLNTCENCHKIMSIWRLLYFDITITVRHWFFFYVKVAEKLITWSYFHVEYKARTLQTHEIYVMCLVWMQ
jgi:hypothetical protein